MIRFAEFCAGIGGFRLGLEAKEVGWECIYKNEIDSKCDETYDLNFHENFDSDDVFDLNIEELPDFEVLCAGFPCQPFSIAGLGHGFNDPRGTIIFRIIEIVEMKRPEVVFLENVVNILRHNNGDTYSFIKQRLEELNYTVYSSIIDSAYFGVPQSRPRVYIIAFSNNLNHNNFTITERRTDRTILRNFINYGDYSIPISDRWNEYIDLYTGKKTLGDMSFDVPKTRRELEKIGRNVDLDNCIFQIRSSGIRAVSIDEPFPTFAVSNSGGGAMIPVYSGERRHLNLIEVKRVMGFPEWFTFSVSRTDAIKQLANAVCPPVITSLGIDIRAILEPQR